MIFGTEEPALFPVKDLYDTGMILSYINSVQREYERGIAEQKEFLKNFGDFFSPISKDMESWDNLTMKPIRDAMNFMLQNGIDPVRSAEGRALLGRLVNNINYGDLAKLKQSAKNAELYQQSARELAKSGLFNKDMALSMDGDLSQYDTLGNGTVWDKTSPDRFESMEQILLPTIKQLENARVKNEAKSAKEPGYIISDVPEDKVRGALNNSFVDLMQNPSMQYFKKKSGLSDDQFKDLIFRQVSDLLGEKREVDQGYFNMENLRLNKANYALNVQKARDAAELDRAKAENDRIKNQTEYLKELNKQQKTFGSSWSHNTLRKALSTYGGLDIGGDARLGYIITQDKDNSKQLSDEMTKNYIQYLQSKGYNVSDDSIVKIRGNRVLIDYSKVKSKDLPSSIYGTRINRDEFNTIVGGNMRSSSTNKQDSSTTVRTTGIDSGFVPSSSQLRNLRTNSEADKGGLNSFRHSKHGSNLLSQGVIEDIGKEAARLSGNEDWKKYEKDFTNAKYTISYYDGVNYQPIVHADGSVHERVKVKVTITGLKLKNGKGSSQPAPITIVENLDLGKYSSSFDLDGNIFDNTKYNIDTKISKTYGQGTKAKETGANYIETDNDDESYYTND